MNARQPLTYVSHLCLFNVLQPLALPPRVLFGPRTSQTGALSSDTITLRSISNQEGYAVLHATAEAADACCALRFARTVFFSQGATSHCQQQCQQQQLGAIPPGQTSGQTSGQTLVDFEVDQQDLFDLLAWYQAVVEAAWAGVRHFATEVCIFLPWKSSTKHMLFALA